MTKVNLRQHESPTKTNIEEILKDSKITRLTPKMIEYLEYLVPMKIGPTPFKRMGWDCNESRHAIVELCMNGVISDKVMNLEARRRRKKKIG